MSAPVVVLERSGVRRLREGHPWIYDRHLAAGTQAGVGLVRLEGPAGRQRGFAVHNPASRIPLRVVSRDAAQVLSDSWWMDRLDAAVTARGERLAPGEDACRWVHAEADGLPGLVVDRYGDVGVLQAGCQWADQVAGQVACRLVEVHGLSGVLARHDGAFRRPEELAQGVEVLAGQVPECVTIRQGEVEVEIDVWHGQKTGTYLDQRSNQRAAPGWLPLGPVLDACCYEGGFALQLAAAGRSVEAVDSSNTALGRALRHAQANGLAERMTFHKSNVFEHLRACEQEGRRFGGIVLDPPALAKRKADLPAAQRGYKELNLRALRLLAPGGRLLTCSCSARLGPADFLAVLRAAASDSGRSVTVLLERGAASCHPHLISFPESAYLKVVLLEVR